MRLALRVAAVCTVAIAPLAACGGSDHAMHASGPAPRASTSPRVEAPFTSDVPRASLPPPPRFTSKRADVKDEARASACAASYETSGGAPASELSRFVDRCGTGMHAIGAPFSGTANEAGAPQRFKIHVDAGKCYRAFGVVAPSVKNVELLLVDGDGIPATEARSDRSVVVAAPTGKVCWNSAGDAEVVLSVGSGEGAFAVEVMAD